MTRAIFSSPVRKTERANVVTWTSAWTLESQIKVLRQSFYVMDNAPSCELSCMGTCLVLRAIPAKFTTPGVGGGGDGILKKF